MDRSSSNQQQQPGAQPQQRGYESRSMQYHRGGGQQQGVGTDRRNPSGGGFGGQHHAYHHHQHQHVGHNKLGLFGFNTYSQRRFSIPLKSVAIRARVVDFFARVEVTQEYLNQDRNPVEVTYTFPTAARAAVCAFSAEVDGRQVVAEVKESEEAADMYDDAISSSHGAFTGRSERPNVFTAVVGNLPPGKQAAIHITYVTELGFDRNTKSEIPKLRFALPARLAPKHKKHAQGYSSSFYEKRPDFKLSIEVDFALSSRIAGISSSQPVSINLPSPSEAKVTLGSMVSALKHDFTLLISLDDKLQNDGSKACRSYGLLEALSESESEHKYAAALVLYPKELFPASVGNNKAREEEESDDEEETIPEKDEDENGEKEGEKEEKGAAPEAKKPAAKKEKPSITDLRLDWGDLPAKEKIKNTAIPSSIFFSRGVLFLYSMLPQDALSEGQGQVKVTLKGKLGNDEINHDLFINTESLLKEGSTLHQLYARSAIRALEKGIEGKTEEEIKKEIIDLSTRYTLASRYTTFIAIEERKEATEGTMERRIVPLNGLGYRQAASGRGRGRGRGQSRGSGFPSREAPDRGFGHWDNRGDRRADRGGQPRYTGPEGGSDSWGRAGRAKTAPVQHKKLEITEELIQQLVELKGTDKDFWLLNSALAKLLDHNITQIVDALVGVPIVDYISNIWATALATAVLDHFPQKGQHAAVVEKAHAWLDEETKKYFLDDKDKWLAKAKTFLHL